MLSLEFGGAYASVGEVMYAQTVTSRIVRKAPANPESTHSSKRLGKIMVVSQGMKYLAERLAMIPAMKPSSPNKANILILSPIVVTLSEHTSLETPF